MRLMRMRKTALCGWAAMAGCLALAATSRADTMQAITSNTGSNAIYGQSEPLDLANQFAVTDADGITVTALGFYNFNAPSGLAASHTVGLFSLSNTGNDPTTAVALTSATVASGTTDPLEGGYRFVTLGTPIYLPEGDYAVVAYDMTSSDPYANSSVTATGPGISFQYDTYDVTSNPPGYPFFPTGGDPSLHSAGSFLYNEGNTVPEPASLGLMGIGSIALLMRRRRARSGS